jgi:hypothetical protein
MAGSDQKWQDGVGVALTLHDSRAADRLPMRAHAGAVRADPSWRSEEMEARLRARGLTRRIHRKGQRGPSR